MLFSQCYPIVIVFYFNFIASVFTYYDDYDYGISSEAGRDANVALDYTVGRVDGDKYGAADYDYVQQNYGKYDDFDDYGYDYHHGGEGYKDGHDTLADRAMRKLKEMKRRKHNYGPKDYEEGYGYGPEVEEYKETGYYRNDYYEHKPPLLPPLSTRPPPSKPPR
ncbi:hypothetical protein MN116_004997 [Schistosoma mekongi]|uniref:Uncharacterized protein n=1 Tax=Schistosoma mekongi TaxID=38744 RepID=A0AAE2D557_SCHME|nr:hypothetical protein MN116_004997 [Schistosoma mekongi]